jgi:hypothetical protein
VVVQYTSRNSQYPEGDLPVIPNCIQYIVIGRGESILKVSVATPCALSFTCITIKHFRFQVQQPLPNNQDIQQSLEFMCTLHHIHLHHLLGQVIAAIPNTRSNNRLVKTHIPSNLYGTHIIWWNQYEF